MNQHEFRELSAGHALHTLTSEEERAFAAALIAHPEWQHIVDADLDTAAGLGRSATEVSPPPSVRSQLLDAIADVPQRSDGVVDEPPGPGQAPPPLEAHLPRRSRARWIGVFALAASLFLVTAVLLTPTILGLSEPEDPSIVALQRVEDSADASATTVEVPGGGSATLHWSDSEAVAVLVAEEMAEPEPGTDFELWVVRGNEPISLGVMDPEDDGQTVLVADTFIPGDVFAVTIEQVGGSPSGLPTSDPILAIETA